MDLLTRIESDMAFESNVRKSYIYRFLMEFQLWLPIWVLYLVDERGFSYKQFTLLDTPFFLLIVLAEVPTGAVADRWGRRVSLMLGSGFFAVAILVFGVADSYAIILISYVAWGLALTFQSGADIALLYDSLKEAGREDEFQKINGRLWALRSVAVVLALLLGAPLAAATSYTFVITLSALIAACALPVAFFMHEPRHRDTVHEPYFSTIATGVREVWRAPALRYIILYSGIISVGVFGPLVFQQPTLSDFGIDVAYQGFLQAPVRAAGIVSALSIGWLLARTSERAVFFALPVVLSICTLALAGIDQSWVLVAFIGLGLVGGLQNPLFANYINHRIPSERRATMLSVQSLVLSLLLAGAQPLAGFFADTWGLQAMYLMYAVAIATCGMVALILWDRAEHDDPEVTGSDDGSRERLSEIVSV